MKMRVRRMGGTKSVRSSDRNDSGLPRGEGGVPGGGGTQHAQPYSRAGTAIKRGGRRKEKRGGASYRVGFREES